MMVDGLPPRQARHHVDMLCGAENVYFRVRQDLSADLWVHFFPFQKIVLLLHASSVGETTCNWPDSKGD